jgi:tetratricopeptide (TPR) repeat protein
MILTNTKKRAFDVIDSPISDSFKVEGNRLLAEGKPKEACVKYTKAIDSLPSPRQLVILLSNRSAAYLQTGDMEPALVDAFEAVKLDPSWPKAHFRKAAALYASKRTRKAFEACEAGLKQDPDYVTLKSLRAELAMQLSKEYVVVIIVMLTNSLIKKGPPISWT